ncbi:uncharacterized protein TNCV_2899361 [Trichonephila clavipes]|nr:uncharacterized protein TNCV_2899361 [Trichonephila clavipes]
MPRNPDGIKRSTLNADNITAAAEAVLKDGVRTAVRQFGASRTTLQRHIAFCRKTNNSENMESNCAYYNRCVVWTVFSNDEESALISTLSLHVICISGCQNNKLKSLLLNMQKRMEKNIPSPGMHMVTLAISGTLIL